MSPSIDDLRNYISIRPIPTWQEAKDARLTARSLDNYSLSKPDRKEVFKTNYSRRQKQMSVQGYKSLLWKPYQELGKPLYLNSRQLLQESLGQTNANTISHDEHGSFSEEQTDSSSVDMPKHQHRPKSAPGVRYHSKESQNLFNDLAVVRVTLESVKKGTALFPMLEKAQNVLENKFLMDKQNELENLHEDLQSMYSQSSQSFGQNIQEKLGSAMSRRASSARSSRSVHTVLERKSSIDPDLSTPMNMLEPQITTETVRPYTPIFLSICSKSGEPVQLFSVWKQLCCLHWILESCILAANTEHVYPNKEMGPLSECWEISSPGGKTRDSYLVSQDRRTNHRWNKFTRNQSYKSLLRSRTRRKISAAPFQTPLRKNWSFASDLANIHDDAHLKRPSSGKSSIITSRHDVTQEGGDQSITRPSSAGQSSITTIAGCTFAESEFGDDDASVSGHTTIDKKEETVQVGTHKNHLHLVKLLSTVQESVTHEMNEREVKAQLVAKSNKCLPMSVIEWAYTNYFKFGRKEINISNIIIPSGSSPITQEDKSTGKKHTQTIKLRPHTAAHMSRKVDATSQEKEILSKNKPKRPMSSPAKLGHSTREVSLSEKSSNNLHVIKEKFEHVSSTTSVELRNQLHELNRYRKQRLAVKYKTLHSTCSMQRDFKAMRDAAHSKQFSQTLNKSKRSSIVISEWYNTLLHNLSEKVHDDDMCARVLQKIRVIAMKMLDDSYRITPEIFLESLKILRPWELCSPDVSASIEFVREHIVEMSAKDFDAWRHLALDKNQ